MLERFSIRNFAVIKAVDMDFCRGVTVFTGETGAGKSILIDALNIIMGARASVDYIRNGTESFLLTAVFNISNNIPVQKLLESRNVLVDENNNELIISRRLDNNGRGQIYVNGVVTPLRILAEIGDLLVDIHGQHDNWKLLKPDFHLLLVDSFVLRDSNCKTEYQNTYYEWKKCKKELADIEKEIEEKYKNKKELISQEEEIRMANLQPSEDEMIDQRLGQVENAEKITENLSALIRLLNETDGIQDLLSRAVQYGEKLVDYGIDTDSICEQLNNALIQSEEVTRESQDYLYNLEFSPEELNHLQERQYLIRRLKRKYGDTIDEILMYGKQIRNSIDSLDDDQYYRDELSAQVNQLYQKLISQQKLLNQCRQRKATELCQLIRENFYDLDMPECQLEFIFEEGQPNENGVDYAEFLFSANPGEPPKPMSEIASGGELARFALAVKSIMTKDLTVPTLVLDEVDVGISGNAAIQVGKRIQRLGKFTQVLCITHLAQTAAAGDHHYYLQKEIADGQTESKVKKLTEKEHIKELARMLEGNNYSSKAVATAENLVGMMR